MIAEEIQRTADLQVDVNAVCMYLVIPTGGCPKAAGTVRVHRHDMISSDPESIHRMAIPPWRSACRRALFGSEHSPRTGIGSTMFSNCCSIPVSISYSNYSYSVSTYVFGKLQQAQ